MIILTIDKFYNLYACILKVKQSDGSLTAFFVSKIWLNISFILSDLTFKIELLKLRTAI